MLGKLTSYLFLYSDVTTSCLCSRTGRLVLNVYGFKRMRDFNLISVDITCFYGRNVSKYDGYLV